MSTVQKTEQFTANFVDIEYVNPLFSKCKVKVLYTGDNRNNSSFTKDVVESALPSIYNIPIVGEFVEKQKTSVVTVEKLRFLMTKLNLFKPLNHMVLFQKVLKYTGKLMKIMELNMNI